MLRVTGLGSRWHPGATFHLFVHTGLFAVLAALFTASTFCWKRRWLFFGIVVVLGLGTEFYESMRVGFPLETPDVLVDTVAAACALVLTAAFIGDPESNGYLQRIAPQIVLSQRTGRQVALRIRTAGARIRLRKGALTFRTKPRRRGFSGSFLRG